MARVLKRIPRQMMHNAIASRIVSLTAFYSLHATRIQNILLRANSAMLSGSQRGKITTFQRERFKNALRQIRAEILELNKSARAWPQRNIPFAYGNGAARASISTGNALAMGGQIHRSAISVLAAQMQQDLLDANASILRTGNRYLRATQQQLISEAAINRAISTGLIEGATRKQVTNVILAELQAKVENGQLISILGKDGITRLYDPEKYSKMVARTRTREATAQGTLNTSVQYGVDLVKFSTHGGSDDECDPFQGKVYSISGSSKRFPPISVAIPVHPNCRHIWLPQPALQLEEEAVAA